MADELLVYGSYGYIGSLIARTAVDEGLSPVLAGRRAEPLEEQALELDLEHRAFSLDHTEIVEREVGRVDAVLNCAGPFSSTAEPIASACLRSGTDYLDLAGAIDVLEAHAERDRDAEEADVVVLPGVGFDVVATDCLAASLHSELPSATHLTLGLDGLGTFSPGTVKSIVEGLGRQGAIRENGRIRQVPAAWRTREIDFGEGPKPAVSVPWGDVSTAYYSTGIENIESYATVPRYALAPMRWGSALAPVLGWTPVQRALKALAGAVVSGPDATERAQSTTRVWAEVRTDGGERTAAHLRAPDTYDLAREAAVESARRVLAGEVDAGFQTPASAFGADFVLEFDGVDREDVAPATSPEASDATPASETTPDAG